MESSGITQNVIAFVLEHFLTIGGFLLAVALVAQVLREPRPTSGALAWVMGIVLIPYVAVPLYVLLGGRKLGQIARLKVTPGLGQDEGAPDPDKASETERILAAYKMPPPTGDNLIELYDDGQEAYHALLELFESAEVSIHCMTFILGRDDVGRKIVETLARKAEEGVEVRLLLDGFFWLFNSRDCVRPLKEAGGKVGIFFPVVPIQRKWSANLRNHRKIVVCDGNAAMIGGMNLAQNYMGPEPDPDRFLDTAVFVRGPVVRDIAAVFRSDWHYATDEALPEQPASAGYDGGSRVQVLASGPDVPEDTFFDTFLTAAMEARERIWVVTPYFVPNETILKTLLLQARMGRDVRIILPLRSNHRIPDLARGPAVRALQAAGAKVYAYDKGMVHSKLLLFDDTLAVTGSPNLDMRSFYLNFEIALIHYSKSDIETVGAWMAALAEACVPMPQKKPSLARQWLEGLSRLMSPLL